tara:strand:- start:26 stop:301 length:276 start_codon:yes stop_codon:yes gene_type:complete
MPNLNLKADEIDLPTSAGAGTSFTEATLVRLVNTAAAGTNHIVTVQETAGGTGVGTFTLPGQGVEYLEKVATWTVFASNAAVVGTKVGFTN